MEHNLLAEAKREKTLVVGEVHNFLDSGGKRNVQEEVAACGHIREKAADM